MTDKERGEFIVKFFTELKEEVTALGGGLDQEKSIIAEHPRCGSTACLAGWIAHKAQTEPHEVSYGQRFRKFSQGTEWLRQRLELNTMNVALWIYKTGLWHNDESLGVFGSTDWAYNGDGTTTPQQACDYWVAYGKRLIA